MNGHAVYISNSLYSLGAHIGHLRVDAYASLSFYVSGGRHYFIVFDIAKTIPLLKKALLFFAQLVSRFGNVVFSYSGVARSSVHLKYYLTHLINAHNHSFSYWRWLPGCITNYRYVFLRLVSVLFTDVRVGAMELGLRTIKRTSWYTNTFMRAHSKLWIAFVKRYRLYGTEVIPSARNRFMLLFSRCKNTLLHSYIKHVQYRKVASFMLARQRGMLLEHAELQRLYNSLDSSLINMVDSDDSYGSPMDISDDPSTGMVYRPKGEHGDGFRILPNFTSMLLRICYTIRTKYRLVLMDVAHVNEEVLFTSLYRRMFAFWRAVIFFRCFKNTANLPDCLLMLNPDSSSAEYNDFKGVRLPIISIADTVTRVDDITYPIPSNDDSLILLVFYYTLFLTASAHAKHTRASLYLLD